MKYVATVSYCGQNYSGFQRQRNGLKSIQGELERALSFALGVETQIKGAGRTDAGVNAIGQRVSFVSERPLDENFINLWNHLLPLDIQVTKIDEMDVVQHVIRKHIMMQFVEHNTIIKKSTKI